MTDLLGDGGVMKLTRAPGSGAQVPPGSRVTVHYVGQFEGFDEPFDSTYVRNRGRPETHLVGERSQVRGLGIGRSRPGTRGMPADG